MVDPKGIHVKRLDSVSEDAGAVRGASRGQAQGLPALSSRQQVRFGVRGLARAMIVATSQFLECAGLPAR